jgi:hypothetical protein
MTTPSASLGLCPWTVSLVKCEGRKQFFFEKKNQKTLDYIEPGGAQEEKRGSGAFKSFLVLSFKKELLPSLH